MDFWLLELMAFKRLHAYKRDNNGVDLDAIAARTEADGRRFFETEYAVVEGVARIGIGGVLSKIPDVWAYFCEGGNTTYQSIIASINAAEADASVDTIELHVSSPGGSVMGLYEAMDRIAATEKPTKAIVEEYAFSAAYGIVSQADEIIATSEGAGFGSVGVVQEFYVDDSIITVTSTEAPDKRPDVTDTEGVAVIKKHLDAHHDLFVKRIAAGRNLSIEDVNKKFGRGATLLACDSRGRGMIDALEHNFFTAKADTSEGEKAHMNLDELKAKHPELYKSVLALGAEEGTQKERSRAAAHLKIGEASGAMDIALKAISEGKAFQDDEIQADYMAARMNKTDLDETRGDDVDTGDQPEAGEDGPDLQDQIANLAAEEAGINSEAK